MKSIVAGLVAVAAAFALLLAVGVELLGVISPEWAGGIAIAVAMAVYFGVEARSDAAKRQAFAEDLTAVQERSSESEPLAVPCRVTVTRLSSFAGKLDKLRVFLNGNDVGVLKDGEALNLSTDWSSNELLLMGSESQCSRPLQFTATSGGHVSVRAKHGKQPELVPPPIDGQGVPTGWYPDPRGRHQLRYWSGSSWTEHVSDQGRASIDPA